MPVRVCEIPDGRPSAAGDALIAVLPAVLAEIRGHCSSLYHTHGSSRCDLRFSRRSAGTTLRIDGECACRDFVADMITEAYRLLNSRTDLRNPSGAVRIHLRTRGYGDWIRHRRLEQGAQVRCDRIRGSKQARELPSDFHRALLEFLCDEAGLPVPLEGENELVQRLGVRCAAEFETTADMPARIRVALREIEQTCRGWQRSNIGTKEQPVYVSWWERYVELPLGRRPRAAAELPAEPVAAGADESAADEEDRSIVEHLVATARRCPQAPESALRQGLADLVARGLVPHRVADSVLGDGERMTDALRQLSALA